MVTDKRKENINNNNDDDDNRDGNNEENDNSKIDNRTKNGDDLPEEEDTHYQIYGKRAWEVEYGERCERCNKRIDEFGFCACGSAQ